MGLSKRMGRWTTLADRAGSIALGALVFGGLLLGGCDDEPPGTLDFGVVCENDGECISGVCKETDLGGTTKRCSESCNESTPCANGICGDDGECILGPPPRETPLKIGYLYVGPVGDHGWTKAHDDGRKYMESKLGGQVTVNYSPSIRPPGAPGEIDTFIERGDDVVIGTSFDFLSALQTAANNNPNVNFLTCSGFQVGPNMGSYFGRMYQVMYLLGILAGSVTSTEVIGIVGPVIIPETVRHVNAFTLGVRAANPDARVVVSWIGDWFSTGEPPEEQVAVDELVIDHGADIIFGNTDTPIPMTRVNKMQDGIGEAPADEFPEGTAFVHTIGYDNYDSCNFSPDTCLSSGYWNWGPIITQVLQGMINGDWMPSELIWESIQNNADDSMVYYTDINPDLVDASVIQEVANLVPIMAEETDLGIYYPFREEVRDSQGSVRYTDGEYPTDEELLNMCWYVEGASDTDEVPDQVPPECEQH